MSERRFPWRTLLFVSVAFNLLIVGAVAGAIGAGVRVERQAAGAAVDRMPGVRAFMAALPPEARAGVRRELVRSWRDSRDLRQAAAQARRDAFVAAAAEPYDLEQVRAAFARMRQADAAVTNVFHDNVVRAFAELTPQQRREALSALRGAALQSQQRSESGELTPAELEDVAPDPDRPGLDGRTLQERREAWRERREERLRERREQQAPTP